MNKNRLENKIDNLPEDIRFRERKLHDMTLRLDGLYDIIIELEEKIEDIKLHRKALKNDVLLWRTSTLNWQTLIRYMIKSEMKRKISYFFANQRNRDFPM